MTEVEKLEKLKSQYAALQKEVRKAIVGQDEVVKYVLISIFSENIVFPGLERMVGIETIVGVQNVEYLPDGGYAYTNPGAMIRWILSVAAIGISLALTGVLILICSKKR